MAEPWRAVYTACSLKSCGEKRAYSLNWSSFLGPSRPLLITFSGPKKEQTPSILSISSFLACPYRRVYSKGRLKGAIHTRCSQTLSRYVSCMRCCQVSRDATSLESLSRQGLPGLFCPGISCFSGIATVTANLIALQL